MRRSVAASASRGATVRDWRTGTARARPACLRCWQPTRPVVMTSADYAELLGLYLGDGHITDMPRTQRLRVFLDARYAGIVADARALLARCFQATASRDDRGRHMAVVSTLLTGTSRCLLPQHGPGKKHERRIVLESWQRAHVHAAPWAFLRGCIRSDGCAFLNRTGAYEYLSTSSGTARPESGMLFLEACELVGVQLPGQRRPCADLPSVERCASARARRREGVTHATMRFPAAVVELVDTRRSGRRERTLMGVRVPPAASDAHAIATLTGAPCRYRLGD